jgi:hypothetical protein
MALPPDMAGCTPGAMRPAARKDFDAVRVPGTQKILVYAGDQAPFSMALPLPRQFVDELWQYDASGCGGWQSLTATNSPGARGAYAATFDTKRNRMIVVAGRKGTDSSPPLTNEVWALDVAAMSWQQLMPSGTLPAARVGHQVVYDADRDRIVMFFGDTSKTFGSGILADVWELSFASSADGAWKVFSFTGAGVVAPSGRRDVAASVDGPPGRVVLFGGALDFQTYTNEVWLFDLATNSFAKAKSSGGLPAERFGAKLLYDAPRNRHLLFAGHDAAPATTQARSPPTLDCATISGRSPWMPPATPGFSNYAPATPTRRSARSTS